MWWRICAIARNWRIAVELSIASAAKFARSGFTLAIALRKWTTAPLLDEVELAFGVEPAADRVVQLLGVHPEVDPAHPEPVGAHRRGERLERDGALGLGAARLVLERLDVPAERQQLARVVGGQPVGGDRQRGRVGQVGGEVAARARRHRRRPGAARRAADGSASIASSAAT